MPGLPRVVPGGGRSPISRTADAAPGGSLSVLDDNKVNVIKSVCAVKLYAGGDTSTGGSKALFCTPFGEQARLQGCAFAWQFAAPGCGVFGNFLLTTGAEPQFAVFGHAPGAGDGVAVDGQDFAFWFDGGELVALARAPAFVPQPFVIGFGARRGNAKNRGFSVTSAHGVAFGLCGHRERETVSLG